MTRRSPGPVDFELAAATARRPGPVLLTGVQAIARMLVEQHAADAAAGLRTASFVSGYQGSPLGGLDQTLAGRPSCRRTPGSGSCPASTRSWPPPPSGAARSRCPTTTGPSTAPSGVWYGKAPGVDRAGDPMRHGNMCGAHPRGGVLVLAGDDPSCKSSTIPCISERTLAGYGLPVLYPGDAEEIVRLGRYGVALSRASGMWVGMKITADVADGLFAVERHVGDVDILSRSSQWEGRAVGVPADPDARPARVAGRRGADVRAALGDAARVPGGQPDQHRRAGSRRTRGSVIVAGGKTFTDVRQALADLGLADEDLPSRRVSRLLRLGMIHPIERDLVREFARGLDTVLVVEEKTLVRRGRGARRPLRHARRARRSSVRPTATGRPLVPVGGGADRRARWSGRCAGCWRGRVDLAPERRAPARAGAAARRAHPVLLLGLPAQPLHRSCPTAPSRAAASAATRWWRSPSPRASSEVTSITQMGGEGAQWIGQSPFTSAGHMFQNMGDGTFAHSGQLAVQACVAAGVLDHLQAALQPRRRDDGRAGRRGRARGAGSWPRSCSPRASRGSSSAPTSRSATATWPRCPRAWTCGTATASTRPSASLAAVTGRDRADLRPALRRRVPAAAQARRSWRSGRRASSSTRRSARAAATAA